MFRTGEHRPLKDERISGGAGVQDVGERGNRLEAQVVADGFGGRRGEDFSQSGHELRLTDHHVRHRGCAGAPQHFTPAQPWRQRVEFCDRQLVVIFLRVFEVLE